MPDLSTQIREYFDVTAPPRELDTIVTDEVWVGSKSQTRRRRPIVPAWAYGLGALVLVLVVALSVNLLLAGDQNQVVEPTPTTVAPNVETMTDVEVIEAGVAAFFSGDAERVAALFELSDRADEEMRQEAADQAAIDGYLGLDCTEGRPGTFSCLVELRNSLHDVQVVVDDGVITAFEVMRPGNNNILFGSFLAARGRLGGYEDCIFGPFTESCAAIKLENHDAFVEWLEPWTPNSPSSRRASSMGILEAALGAWYGGDCVGAHYLAGAMFYVDGVMFENGYREGADALCPASASSSQTIEYESILGAEMALGACEEEGASSDGAVIDGFGVDLSGGTYSCEVQYSNAMNIAVGKSPSLTVREFRVMYHVGLVPTDSDRTGRRAWVPWYVQAAYPEDTELRESFKQFAESGELADEYAAANCANQRTPDCARLIMDNLDDWAAWYQANS